MPCFRSTRARLTHDNSICPPSNRQESVQTKAKELTELEERLKQAEARKAALEAKGYQI